jgi:uncharacterized repeat protein (TIGR03806 family)
MPELQGKYLFKDAYAPWLGTISQGQAGGANTLVQLMPSGVSGGYSFAEDSAGAIWNLGYWGNSAATASSFLRRLESATPPSNPVPFPSTLSATGCFENGNLERPASGVLEYSINSPLWSDGAEKRRFFAIPDGQTIQMRSDGRWDFPQGSVLIKSFYLGSRPVETRLMVRHADGDWGGYSYEWNDAGTDATLLTSSKVKSVGSQLWTFPSRSQCLGCHTAPAGQVSHERVLGLETGQMNKAFDYPLRSANQILSLASVGYFSQAVAHPTTLIRWSDPADPTESLENRARAYLHTNCASCHQPGGPGRGPMDFRMTNSNGMSTYCDVAPTLGDLGVPDARLLKPGNAAASTLVTRMQHTGAYQMPPLGVSLSDTSGIGVVQAWINNMTGGCPSTP